MIVQTLLHNILYFVVIMSIIVFVHEMGHYLVAKASGVKIETFSIGFGREIWGFNDRSGTRWSISLLPLGGYVKMSGDRNPASVPDLNKIKELNEEEQRGSFYYKPPLVRALIVVAGPLFNFLFAIIILTSFSLINGRHVASSTIKDVIPDMPAYQAGLKTGDKILKINGSAVKDFSEIEATISIEYDRDLIIQFERDGKTLSKQIKPRKVEIEDTIGNKTYVGRIGVVSELSVVKNYNIYEATLFSVKQIYTISKLTLVAIKQMIVGQRDTNQLSGPIKIAQYSGEVAKHGISACLWFMAMISINLGLVNLLPIPLLDGGHLILYIVEAIKGKPINQTLHNLMVKVGIILLTSLMLFSTFNDIKGIFIK